METVLIQKSIRLLIMCNLNHGRAMLLSQTKFTMKNFAENSTEEVADAIVFDIVSHVLFLIP